MALMDALFGKSGQLEQVDRFGQQQQQGIMQILQQALQGLANPTQGFEPIAQQARTQFQEQTIPSLAERFSALDGQRSSAFQNALGQAGAGLETNLAAQKAQFGQQNFQNLLGLLGQGLTPTFEHIYRPQEMGFIPQLGTAFAQGLGGGLSGGAGGGISQLLSAFGNMGGK